MPNTTPAKPRLMTPWRGFFFRVGIQVLCPELQGPGPGMVGQGGIEVVGLVVVHEAVLGLVAEDFPVTVHMT